MCLLDMFSLYLDLHFGLLLFILLLSVNGLELNVSYLYKLLSHTKSHSSALLCCLLNKLLALIN